MTLRLPASLTRPTVQDDSFNADLEWVLLEAANCIRGGTQLRTLAHINLMASRYDKGRPWGASSNAHHRELGEQLSGLKDLAVYDNVPTTLSAIDAVACSAPSLTRLTFAIYGPHGMVLPPICSASLKRITGQCLSVGHSVLPQPVILTFLAECTQLREVHVQFRDTPDEGASVKIRCHCTSQRCIVPYEGHAEVLTDEPAWRWRAGMEEVGVRFLPTPASPQGVQPYTVMFTRHAAGPEQGPKWGHVVMPGVL